MAQSNVTYGPPAIRTISAANLPTVPHAAATAAAAAAAAGAQQQQQQVWSAVKFKFCQIGG